MSNSQDKVVGLEVVAALSLLADVCNIVFLFMDDIPKQFPIIIIVFSTALFFSALTLRKNRNLRHELFKALAYSFAKIEGGVHIISREREYDLRDLENIKLTVNHELCATIDGLTTFRDRYRWSKPLDIENAREHFVVINDAPYEPSARLTELSSNQNYDVYEIGFKEKPKHSHFMIGITLSGMNDVRRQSLPFLSSGIVTKTAKLTLKVLVSTKHVAKEACAQVYSNYYGTCPVLESPLKYDAKVSGFSWEIEKPVIGYRYSIAWEWKRS